MTTFHYRATPLAPEAFITRGKQRVKQFKENTVYLRNNDEFEIELFNPLQSKILAKIKLNGEYISFGGIVLRPGERVFLERYLDSPKKFKFSTYTVNKKDPAVKRAIKDNGDVEIEFYQEMVPQSYSITYTSYPYSDYYDPFKPSTIPYDVHTSDNMQFRGVETSNTKTSKQQTYLSSTADYVETGRVETGNQSHQGLIADDTSFNFHYSWKTSWKILPESNKPYTASEVNVVYCTNCGAKRRKTSFKFCPHCGTEF